MQDHLQKHLQSEEISSFNIRKAKLDTPRICLIQQQVDVFGEWDPPG
jgi:hypothetical protein